MIYRDVTLIEMVDSGLKDELGNVILEDVSSQDVFKYSGWTIDEINGLGREFTNKNGKIILRTIEGSPEAILIGSERYDVTQIINNNRWTILYVRGYKL